MTNVLLVIVTIVIAWFLPSELEMERLSGEPMPQRTRPEPSVRPVP